LAKKLVFQAKAKIDTMNTIKIQKIIIINIIISFFTGGRGAV